MRQNKRFTIHLELKQGPLDLQSNALDLPPSYKPVDAVLQGMDCFLTACDWGVAGQSPRVVCGRFLKFKVHAAQGAPQSRLGSWGGGVSPESGVLGSAPGKFEKSENLSHKSSISGIL